MDFNISYTFLRTYKQCKRRCYLQYVKQVIPYEKVNHAPFLVGIVVDWLLNNWIKEGYPEGWMEKKAYELFRWWEGKRFVRYKGEEQRRKMIIKTQKTARLLEDIVFAENFPERNVHTQKKVEHLIDGANYIAKFDLYFPDEKALWDLKVTESSKYLDIFQLHFFAWMLGQKSEEVKELAFLSPLMKRSVQRHEWDTILYTETEREIFQLVESIREGIWDADADDCWGCPVVNFCEEDSKLFTKIEKNEKGGFIVSSG